VAHAQAVEVPDESLRDEAGERHAVQRDEIGAADLRVTICSLAGEVQLSVRPGTSYSELKRMAAEHFGPMMAGGGLNLPSELVLVDMSTGLKVLDEGGFEANANGEETRFLLVRRQKCLYTPIGTFGCYTRSKTGEYGQWDTAKSLSPDELLLRRLDDDDHPWIVNGFEIPNMRLARFEVLPGEDTSHASREVYINLSSLRKVTESYKEYMLKVFLILGKPSPFEDV